VGPPRTNFSCEPNRDRCVILICVEDRRNQLKIYFSGKINIYRKELSKKKKKKQNKIKSMVEPLSQAVGVLTSCCLCTLPE